ncbi:hypothetical protein ACF08M_09775 [Streptomyces sp. NPDC015032]|uniref:hypothetical protein n=1 Tax=Streptomyces sp. NPDC015032 TaxID=3364937 RepID=UPI0037024C4E
MIRDVLGSGLAVAGAAAAVRSPFLHWYGGRFGRQYRIDELFTGLTGARPGPLGSGPLGSGPLGSVLLAFLFAALLTVVGVALRSRLLVAAAGVVTLGFTVLWMVRQGEATGSLTVAGDGSGLQWGVVYAAGGAVLMLLGAVVMPGRHGGGQPARGHHDEPYAAPGSENPDRWPPTQEPGPSVQTSPLPEPEPDPYAGPPPERGPESRPEDRDTTPHPAVPDEGPGPERPPHH